MNILYNPNLIKQNKNCCIHCGKSYKIKTNLEKHSLLCDLIYSRKNPKIIIEEEEIEENLPSQKQMYKLLLELGQKYNKLEEKVNEINKYVIKKKKKINIIEWLNENSKPILVFENITEKIIISIDIIEFLFHNSFNDTLNKILNQIYKFDENEIPLFAPDQKNNTFYIYELSGDQKLWIELSNNNLIRFLNNIQKKISIALFEWKKAHQKEINDSDELSTLYDKTTIKIMTPNFKQETLLSKIKSLMYSKFKSNIKAMIEYEFEF